MPPTNRTAQEYRGSGGCSSQPWAVAGYLGHGHRAAFPLGGSSGSSVSPEAHPVPREARPGRARLSPWKLRGSLHLWAEQLGVTRSMSDRV